MRVFEYAQLLGVVFAANGQFDGIRARRLQNRQRTPTAAKSAFALPNPIRADADIRREERRRPIRDALRWRIPEVPVDAVQPSPAAARKSAERLASGILNGDG